MNSAILLLVVCSAAVGVLGGPMGADFHGKFDKCLGENGVEQETFREQFHQEEVTDDNVKCVFSCMAKEMGLMLEDGTVVKEKAINHVPPFASKEKQDEIRQRNTECVEITGANECDTAYLIFKCAKPEGLKGHQGHHHGPPPNL